MPKDTKSDPGQDKPKLTHNPELEDEKPVKQEITGLCVNCDRRFTCHHCRQLGGVWYCEEYE